MKRYKIFTLYWVTNTLMLFLAAMLLPTHFTLGNNLFSALQAALFVGFVWDAVLWKGESWFADLEMQSKNPMVMMVQYLAVNFATLWVLARLAVVTGFGVSSFVYIFGLAFVANFVQYQIWQMAGSSKKKK